jgi:hypothetical protein
MFVEGTCTFSSRITPGAEMETVWDLSMNASLMCHRGYHCSLAHTLLNSGARTR